MKSSRNPGVETLKSDPAYRLVHELGFQDMIPFVLTHIREKGIMSATYMGVNLAMFGMIAGCIILGILDQSLTWRAAFGQSLTGIICGSILVIPVHELLHGAAYRLLGAKSIRFGVDFQQFIFFVTADRYPVSGKQLYFLALTPFVVINAVVIVATLLFFRHAMLLTGFLLLSHNIMCIGDFAIANYVRRAKGRLYSFDEPEKKKSYFFEEVREG
jgi:hypothetical protein